MLQPLADRAAFGESFTGAETFGQIGENSVIVARLTKRRRDRLHRHQEGIVGASADILALQRHGCGKNEIGMPCRCGPTQFMHDQSINLRESPPQAIDILVMMEGVSARRSSTESVTVRSRVAIVV